MSDQKIAETLKKYDEPMAGNVWRVQGTAVIYHKALERIATKAQISFDPPTVIRAERDEAVILVVGRMGKRTEWSIGEALIGANYRVSGKQAAYVWAMAEKRAKDRVILKLIELAGLVYSEDEDDELKNGKREEVQDPPADLKKAAEADAVRLNNIRDKLLAGINGRETVEALEEMLKGERVQQALEEIGNNRRKEVQAAIEARKQALAGTGSPAPADEPSDDPSSRKEGYEHGRSPVSSLPAFLAMHVSSAVTPDGVDVRVDDWLEENGVDWQALPAKVRKEAEAVIERKKMDLVKGR